jgi:outer membrane protein
VPQARAGLLPQVSAQGQANVNYYEAQFGTSPKTNVSQNYGFGSLVFSASQPLYRPQNVVVLDQAREQVTQSDFSLGLAQQDLIIRTTVAYFDVLLAEFNVELAEQQKIAVSEQLAQAKRNFEVGTATITDTNEAQAKYDQIIATEIQARNDLDRRRTALAAIIGRTPQSLRRIGRGFDPGLPEPNNLDYWVARALRENLNVRFAQSNFEIASLEVDRARAGHLPTLDLVASANALTNSGSATADIGGNSRAGSSASSSTSRSTPGASSTRACARRSRCRTARDPTSRRPSGRQSTNAQDGFSGVTSAAAGVKGVTSRRVASAESRSNRNPRPGKSASARTSTC